MKRFLLRLHEYSTRTNHANIFSLLEGNRSSKLLDLGCGNGDFTIQCAKKVGTENIWGVEIAEELVIEAKKKGIKVIRADLNRELPLKSKYFDVIVSNQVLEHLTNIGTFIEGIHRVLKPSGYAVISTENLSSWHNIFALLLGYRPFSQDYPVKVKLGNPISPHHSDKSVPRAHVYVFPYVVFKELFQLYGFKLDAIVGAGYYPMPCKLLSSIMSKMDARHAHFITLKARKVSI